MTNYELVLLLRPELTSAQIEGAITRYREIISASKDGDKSGKVSGIEQWGLRPLTYLIRKNKKAYFLMMNVIMNPADVLELSRRLGLDEEVLRSQIVSVEKFTPSPILTARKNKSEEA